MKGIPRRSQQQDDVQPANTTPAGQCCVAGCKLPGTILEGANGGNDWYCRLHFGAPYAEHADITLRANNRIGLYRLALGWLNDSPNEPVRGEVEDTLRRFRRESLLATRSPVEGRPLTMRTLAAAVLSQLDAECRDARTPVPADDSEVFA